MGTNLEKADTAKGWPKDSRACPLLYPFALDGDKCRSAYLLRLPRHSKLNWPQYPPHSSTCQCLPGEQTLPASAAYLPIGPQSILGRVCPKLNSRAILSNIAFHRKRQRIVAILSVMRLGTLSIRLRDYPQMKWHGKHHRIGLNSPSIQSRQLII